MRKRDDSVTIKNIKKGVNNMLEHSQPVDPKMWKKLGLSDPKKNKSKPTFISEHIGTMHDDMFDKNSKKK